MSQTHDAPDRRQPARVAPPLPRWVKVFLFIAIILLVLFAVLHLTGNGFGDHMHMSGLERGVQSW